MKAEYESGLLTAMESIKISWVKLIVCIKYISWTSLTHIMQLYTLHPHYWWCLVLLVLGKYYSIKIVL